MTTDIFKGLIMLNKTRYKALQHMRKRNNSLSERSWSSCNPKGTCPPLLFSLFAFLCEHYMLGFFFLGSRLCTLLSCGVCCQAVWCFSSFYTHSGLSPPLPPPLGLSWVWFCSSLFPPPVNGELFLSIVTNYLLKWDFWIKSANAPQGPFFKITQPTPFCSLFKAQW